MSDHNNPEMLFANNMEDRNSCFRLSQPNRFAIFELRKQEELELYLQYGYFEVGIPERKNFKLCTIKKQQPIEIKINGKTDFSATSRRERTFKEQHFIIEYVGDFNSCKLLKSPITPHVKQPPKPIKVVDLLKPLW